MKSYLKKILLLCLVITYIISGCSNSSDKLANNSDPISNSALLLNTTVKITLYDSNDSSIIDECFKKIEYYDSLFSRTNENSEIYMLNKNKSIDVSPETAELIEKGLYYSKLSNGAFDIAIAPLTSLWNFSSENPSVPSETDIKEAISHIDYTKISIEGTHVELNDDKIGIDLGAIAKGYIADKIKDYLINSGVNSAIIDLGGNILCVGNKPDDSNFTVGIQNPFESRNEYLDKLSIKDMSLVTSGIYERNFTENNVFYHHILNPSTGYPYDNDLESVSILSQKSVAGDGLSTTCFALGLDEGLKLINSLEDIEAVFITTDGVEHYSDNFKEYII